MNSLVKLLAKSPLLTFHLDYHLPLDVGNRLQHQIDDHLGSRDDRRMVHVF
jgi:hypothetical protein